MQLIPFKLHNYLMEFGTLTQGFYSWSIGISVYLFHSLLPLLFRLGLSAVISHSSKIFL